MTTPELLAPAGTPDHLETAFAYGADAVYAGQPRYSLRVRNNSFKDVAALGAGIERAHELGKQFYLVSNIAPHNSKVRTYLRDLEPIIERGPDALIMSDPGLIMQVRERWPDQPVHLSVQANAVNWATVEFWRRQGLSRVILSRELALDEIREIRERVPQMELEVFVHGALCMAYSGRCLLSGYMNHRDANQGACTNACRWNYKEVQHGHDQTGDLIATSADAVQEVEPREILLEEPNRPGGFIPAYEDEHGTYIMNSKDLRAVQHVAELVKMGVHSLKIEGRTKSTYYVARTTQIYRRAIDDAMRGQAFDMGLMDQLEALSNRGYTEGFLRRHLPQEYQSYEQGSSFLGTQQVVGTIADSDDHWLTVDVKNRFAPGDTLELITPAGNLRFSAERMENRQGTTMTHAPGSGHVVRIPRPDNLPASLANSYLTRLLE
ncbi:tRNA 5-hydroxyuridine modification protein YegQ [Marinobacter koreensis]|uniref:tRNA 5-hydroxyuridine modification protein YegQ n=1 Tax=Marinobacter koreensis TaxID=335974 RepID=A0ABW0RKJ5_9GAMM|nr:tRNA 5-hydroxyuridine modification protein YegQ [Marinobacter koreensis]MCK7546510.1 tRNA 5-hydroxyuridine modification protein YegQ [Marinobacter koreensis]MDX1816624.1 tRNA 5-hydroxyuridine modification protein YegQ [Marinobacter sp.]